MLPPLPLLVFRRTTAFAIRWMHHSAKISSDVKTALNLFAKAGRHFDELVLCPAAKNHPDNNSQSWWCIMHRWISRYTSNAVRFFSSTKGTNTVGRRSIWNWHARLLIVGVVVPCLQCLRSIDTSNSFQSHGSCWVRITGFGSLCADLLPMTAMVSLITSSPDSMSKYVLMEWSTFTDQLPSTMYPNVTSLFYNDTIDLRN